MTIDVFHGWGGQEATALIETTTDNQGEGERGGHNPPQHSSKWLPKKIISLGNLSTENIL